MGEPVRIYDLALKMIHLSGYVPGEDIDLIVTGLRPGEKLYEELLDQKELLMPTHNDKIMIGKVRKHNFKMVNKKIGGLLEGLDQKGPCQLVKEMMEIAPEFVSVNSNYLSCNIMADINGAHNGNDNGIGKSKGNGNGKSHDPEFPTVQLSKLLAPE